MANVTNQEDKRPHIAYKIEDEYWVFGGFPDTPPPPHWSTGYRNHLLMYTSNYWMGVL